MNPIIGTCQKMCPNKEMMWREKNKLLHSFEIQAGTDFNPKADPNKVIKQFTRSAAGKLEQSASDLRPSNVLLKTMDYLINTIVPLDSVSWIEVYNFVDNRVQAIRQDITIQMIQDKNALVIYEKCVRFYIASSYILCEQPQSKFDQHLNSKQLSVCLEKVISLYQNFQSDAMNEIISIQLSLNISHNENFYRSLGMIENFLNDHLVKLTLRACISWIDGNFIRFFAYIKKLPVILQICFFHQFGVIRRRALKVLSIAYSSLTNQLPLEILSNWLCLSNQNTIELCHIFNIKTDKKLIHFNKKDFDVNALVPKISKENLIESQFRNIDLVVLITNLQ